VLLLAAGNAGLGAIEVAEEEDLWVIATDTEQERLFPNAVLTSVVKRTGQVIYGLVEAYVKGKEIKDYSVGVKEECIGLSTWTRESKDNVPSEVRRQMEEIDDKLGQGLIIIK
ncbi:MAG: BMP family ABC transporter substrate-binding protein, partial [Synergistaceae bacterium]